jgi:ATPase subunit of ABC transporter with duplicated ATPase domains
MFKKKLELRNLSFKLDSREIFKDLNLQIFSGDKMVLIGENGVGKSTLLKIIKESKEKVGNGVFSQFQGELICDGDIGYLPQSFSDSFERSVMEHSIIESGDKKIIDLLSNRKNDDDPKEFEKEINKSGFYEILKEMKKILHIDDDFFSKKFLNLSGGEKTKIHLVSLFYKNPDILLLDEPTNNLDSRGIE